MGFPKKISFSYAVCIYIHMLSIIRLSKDLSCLKKEKQGSHKTWKHSSNKGKYVHRLSLSFARKSVVRLTDHLNMIRVRNENSIFLFLNQNICCGFF